MQEDEHVIEALGRSRIKIKDGAVVEVGPSMISECPLAKRFSQPVIEISEATVRSNVEQRIKSFGMCTKHRNILSEDDFAIFGASELISEGIRGGILDAAVIACDGAGTVIATTPQLVQGIGGRMSGLVRTTSIPEVMERIEKAGGKVLDMNASINQVRGTELAFHLGFKSVAVTVTGADDAEEIRESFPHALIFGVHLTGVGKGDAERLVLAADILAGCASKWVREIAGEVALLQAGTSIPVFALTKKGKVLIAEKLKSTNKKLLIKIEKIPYSDGKSPKPLV